MIRTMSTFITISFVMFSYLVTHQRSNHMALYEFIVDLMQLHSQMNSEHPDSKYLFDFINPKSIHHLGKFLPLDLLVKYWAEHFILN